MIIQRSKLLTAVAMTGGCMAALAISQPAKAGSSVTFYTEILACQGFETVDNGDCEAGSGQARPVQLPITGIPITNPDPLVDDRQVRFMQLDLGSIVNATGGFTGATGFQWSPPPGFPVPPQGQARVDYKGGSSDNDCSTSSDPNCTINWTGVEYDFRPGYVVGSCTFCGPNLRFDRINLTGNATRIGGASNTGLNFNQINGRTVVNLGDPSNVRQAYLDFQATSNFLSAVNSQRINSGYLTLTLIEVPGPLPIAGAAMAFGYSRKLRKRINQNKPQITS